MRRTDYSTSTRGRVDQLDLSAFRAAYRSDGHGRAAYDAAILVAVLLYAYCLGWRFSRVIKRCRRAPYSVRMYVLKLAFDADSRRLQARPAHRDNLLRLHAAGLLVMAGPWNDDSGALLIFRTDETGIREIIASDPYYSTHGVSVVSVREWDPVVGA